MNVPETIILDIRGQICPSTLLTTLRTIARHKDALKAGRLLLAVRTDNRDATATIPEAARNMGYAVNVERAEGCYLLLIGREAVLPAPGLES